MSWIIGYITMTAITASAIATVIGRNRDRGAPRPKHQLELTLAAGFAWPILLVGGAQLAIIAACRAHLRRR